MSFLKKQIIPISIGIDLPEKKKSNQDITEKIYQQLSFIHHATDTQYLLISEFMHKSINAVSIVIGPLESGNLDSNTKRNLDFLRDEAFSFEPGELEIDKKMRMNLMVVKDCNKNIL